MKWAYGITTVPSRVGNLLDTSLQSLALAGFPEPRLFIEGSAGHEYSQYKLQVTTRETPLHKPANNLGNWYLALWELYIREPLADRYALFEDDILLCRGVKQYLDACQYPKNGYWNLHSAANNVAGYNQQPKADQIAPASPQGWTPSAQKGKGALALVFNREALTTLLMSSYFVKQPQAARGWRSLDGTILTSFVNAGYKEYIHLPSFVQHLGDKSTMGHGKCPPATTFPGETFNAIELL